MKDEKSLYRSSTKKDLVCNLLDIPVYEEGRLDALHLLFETFIEYKRISRSRLEI